MLSPLVRLANGHLNELCSRFELRRAPGSDLALQVVDHEMAGEVRGLHNLSRGERFLMSLALALELAGMSPGRGVKVEGLFIDTAPAWRPPSRSSSSCTQPTAGWAINESRSPRDCSAPAPAGALLPSGSRFGSMPRRPRLRPPDAPGRTSQ